MTRTRPARPTARAVALTASLALASVGALATACAPTFRGAPVMEPLVHADPQVEWGERVFAHACHECHPHALAGLGPGIIDRPIPNWLVRLQVRVGLGVMPAFSADEIDDEELDALIAYLDALRRR
jgi:mono/diheme cytochrome c family protein